jgi:hypothetical protein
VGGCSELTVLEAILVAGSCPYTHSALANVYLLSVSYVPNTGSIESKGQNANITSMFSSAAQRAHLTVRTGYFGLCAKVAMTFPGRAEKAQMPL